MIRDYFHRWEQELAAVSKRIAWSGPSSGAATGSTSLAAEMPDPRIRTSPAGSIASWQTATRSSRPSRRATPSRGAGHRARRRRGRRADVSERPDDAARRKQHRACAATFPPIHQESRSRAAAAPRGGGAGAVEFRRQGHIGLCQILRRLGIASLRISLPYHDARMPPELTRADYIVSSNVVRTLQVCRQAVRDVRLRVWWLRDQGYDRSGLLGTSLGSCLSLLTTCSRAASQGAGAQSRVAVVRRRGVARAVDRARAAGTRRPCRRRISCAICGGRSARGRFSIACTTSRRLMVYALYDLTFPVDLSVRLIEEIRAATVPAGRARYCPAATTRPAQRPSNTSMLGTCAGFSQDICRNRLIQFQEFQGFQKFQRHRSAAVTGSNLYLTLGTSGTLEPLEP